MHDDSAVELNSQSLRCFLSVADHESYTRAAVALALSQPGVHQHVRKLEAELGTKLVEQHGKRVVLTEHGRVVYQYARRLHDEEGDLIRYLRDDASLEQGQLRIAGGTTAAEFLIPTISVAFQRLHPGIQIRVRAAGTTEEVDGGVADHTFDLGMHSSGAPWPGVEKLPFLEDVLVGIAPVGHRLVDLRRPATPADIARDEFIHFGVNDAAHSRQAAIQLLIHDWFANADVEPPSRLNVGSLEGIKRAVRDGGGVAIVSPLCLDPEDAQLVAVPLAAPPRRNFFVITRESGWESNVVRAFRDFVVSLCWSEGDARQFAEAKPTRRRASARTI